METKQKKRTQRYAILCNANYGIYAGVVGKITPQTDGMAVEVAECRHVARWYGKTGGITSLAAHGLCGPRVSESRVGAAVTRATLTQIVNIFDCSPEARRSLEATVQLPGTGGEGSHE